MVKNKLNLSLNEPYVRQVYAKEGDSGRLYELDIDPTPTENGTMRIKRPDGVEVTSPASLGEDITDSGEVVSFDALDEAPLTSLKVGIEPIQDLHGQSNPYPAGGGKNLLNNQGTSATVSNVIYTVNADGTITTNGTSNGWNGFSLGNQTLKAGTYILSSGISDAYRYNQYLSATIDGNSVNTQSGDETTFTVTSAETTFEIKLYTRPNQSPNQTVYPMIRLSSVTDSTYAPYSNICPIYANVGKNLLPNNLTWTLGIRDDNGNQTSSTSSHYSNAILIKPSTTYTVQGLKYGATTYRIYYLTESKGWISRTAVVNNDTYTFTTPSNCVYIQVQCSSQTDLEEGAQLELGSSATSYVPYNTQTVEQSGKNFFEFKNVGRTNNGVTYTLNDDGTLTLTNTASGTSFLVATVAANMLAKIPKGSYILSGGKSNNIRLVATTYSLNGASATKIEDIATDLGSGATFTLTEDSWVGVNIRVQSGQATNVDIKAQIEKGSTATSWEQFNREEYNSTLPQLVYGGTLDVAQGKLTIDHAIYTVSSFLGSVEGNGFRASSATNLPNYNGGAYGEIKCNMFAGASSYGEAVASIVPYTDNANKIGANGSGQLLFNAYVNGAFATTINEVNALIPSEGCQIWYPCTETVIDLTPQQINTLLGENNIWASCGDVLEVAFAYDGMLSALPSQATEVVGRCIGDVELGGVSTMPFTLVVQKNNQGE